MSRGFAGTLFLTTEDCRAAVEELRARGVEITEEPPERPCGLNAPFRDSSGNSLRIAELRPLA